VNVLFISECSGNALKETRRILDQFAERRGERTWQTSITLDGMEAVRKLLRKTARKNTAVICHWIRGLDHSEVLWIVGNSRRFNSSGAVPTNTTSRNILRNEDENKWHSLTQIYLLTGLAALLHDLGKACAAFQNRLRNPSDRTKNLYRHEWISLRLFQAFVGNDDDQTWLSRLMNPTTADNDAWLSRLIKDGPNNQWRSPFRNMPPLAQAVGWLVLTHHRLPMPPKSEVLGTVLLKDMPESITSDWNEPCDEQDKSKIAPYWTFPHNLPVTTAIWSRKVQRLARKLSSIRSDNNPLDDPFVMHISRLCLMLADHHYSSLEKTEEGRVSGEQNYPLYANTKRSDRSQLNQPLDEHLIGVQHLSGQIVHSLPEISANLPRLGKHRALRQRADNERFAWQDRVFELAESHRIQAAVHGAFIVNMASTGCGKTFANAKIMAALSDPDEGLRCAFALGLRTLTMQTGREYRQRLKLSESEVAIMVGGTSIESLQQTDSEESSESDEASNWTGSESVEELVSAKEYVFFDESPAESLVLKNLLQRDNKARKLLLAPILVCTIDQLIPATESTRGGHQIAPMLRFMSGDVVLDEIDDYDIDDLPAVTRLMHWAGLLGSKVLISSATLPPDLVLGMFEAYLAGRKHFQRNVGEDPSISPDICCIWTDEFESIQSNCTDLVAFEQQHQAFTKLRASRLAESPILRRTKLIPVTPQQGSEGDYPKYFASRIPELAVELHEAHAQSVPGSNKKVSFGLVRIANIDPMFDIGLELLQSGVPPDHRFHLCVYHSQHPLLVRSAIERVLDQVLDRRKPDAVFDNPDVVSALAKGPETHHIFMVLASPVAEVGRDHDYDWAIVEPSSMRSIIQLAGRIRRHRREECTAPNLYLFRQNIRSVEQPQNVAYYHPGFETKGHKLSSHDMEQILNREEWESIDARPRIQKRAVLKPTSNLVDLEHERLNEIFQQRVQEVRQKRAAQTQEARLGAYSAFHRRALLSGILQREQPFRLSRPETEVVLMPNDDCTDYILYRIAEYDGKLIPIEAERNRRISVAHSPTASILQWAQVDFIEELLRLSELLDMDVGNCARKFACLSLPDSKSGWRSHSVLGFSKNRD
jgi:CRISPR-associated endonuclease/helicase Cas3